ncbi:Gfo/Idh/MocA family protein [Gracilibacillus thailandensis]|uniref:Gfo/Idh/MocA family oxidoreductase n=1 Tax=Gracilibacillus thailandensis TaxID=563735 RepID=A0A6N7R0Z2_9BACI|nr:Gfo/Idh/MocA family oxidoreductase [Gracilibacillus thailandensis]MRI67262.1 gfo/Idh/MocA family oxidoreductase [Gracilibacillus thailandensis]
MLKVAIIGTGAICPSHVKSYLQFPSKCKIVALCDIYPEKAEKIKQDFNLDAHVFDNYQDLIDKEEVDLISICTPPYTHADIAIHSLDAGKHVLVEKPMASSLEECDAMVEAGKRNNKILSVVAQNRFTTPMMKLKHVLETELMGPILHTQVDSFWWRGHSYYDLWWRGTWEKEGGGCTLNHAVHHIDIFQWMRGMPSEITAVTSNTAHDNAEVEDISIAIGRYQDGSLAQITSSVVHHGEEQQLIFQGKKARVSVPWKVKASTSKENGFPNDDPELERLLTEAFNSQPDLEYEGHPGQIENVLDAIIENKPVLVDGIQGRQTLELITAIYESANYQRTVTLPLTKESPFYTREGILQNAKHFYEKGASVENFSDTEITTGGKYE